jgi:hypothetical protein
MIITVTDCTYTAIKDVSRFRFPKVNSIPNPVDSYFVLGVARGDVSLISKSVKKQYIVLTCR